MLQIYDNLMGKMAQDQRSTRTSESETDVVSESEKDRPRSNTLEEKRKMRNLRKKRKREAIRAIKVSESDSVLSSLQQPIALAQEHIKLEKKRRSQAKSDAKNSKEWLGHTSTDFVGRLGNEKKDWHLARQK